MKDGRKPPRPAVLLLHGLTGEPAEVMPLALRLRRRGHPVSVPALPGHGGKPEDLAGTRRGDWTNAAEAAFDSLAAKRVPVYVGGLSMGACLSLHLGLTRPCAGILSFSAPIHIRDPRYLGLSVFRFLQWRTTQLTGGILDPSAPRHRTYPWCPTRSLYELKLLADGLRPRLKDLRAPLLVVHGKKDSMVPPENAAYLHREAGSPLKHLLYLDRSDHVITMDYDHGVLEEAVLRFLRSKGRKIS